MLQVDVPFIRCEVIYHGLANGKEEGSRRRSTNTFSSITRHPSTSTAVYSAYRPPFGRLSWEGDFSVVKKITTTIERRQSGCEALSVTRSPYPVNLNCLANNNNNKSKKIKKTCCRRPVPLIGEDDSNSPIFNALFSFGKFISDSSARRRREFYPQSHDHYTNAMTKALKCGYLLRYKRRLFSRYWREEFIVLYEDSSMAWFKDKSRSDPEGALMLKEAPELMAMGEYTLRIPHTRPSSLPQGCTVRQVMAFGTPNRQKVYWFVAKSEDEINDWMTAISNTLPIPPGLSVYGEPADETTSNIYESIDLQPAAAAVTTVQTIEKQQLQQEDVHLVGSHQPCCLCAASGHGCGGTVVASSTGAVVPAITATAAGTGMKKKDNSVNSSLGEIATGMMLATGFAHWGWGYGLGWNKPDKSIIGGYSENMAYDDGYYGRDSMDPRQMGNGCSQQHHYDPDYDDCQDNDFDMDFGGDFGF